MAYELLVMDLDGTLTNSEKKITQRTKEALFRIQEEGVHIALASGRPTPGVMPVAEELELEKYGGYILSFNGANVMRMDTREVIYQNVVPKQFIRPLYEAALAEGIGIISYSSSEIIAGTKADEYMQKESKITHMPIHEVEDFPEFLDFPVNKCLMTADGEYMAEAEKRMQARFPELNVFRSEPYFLEIMPQNVDKAFSLSRLLKYMELSRSQMICCGDGFNDLSMIRYAGLGVAMANAQEVVKKEADYITASNDEDGIAFVVEKFIGTERRKNYV